MNDLNNLLEQITSDFNLNNYGSEAVKQQLNLMFETMDLNKIINKKRYLERFKRSYRNNLLLLK